MERSMGLPEFGLGDPRKRAGLTLLRYSGGKHPGGESGEGYAGVWSKKSNAMIRCLRDPNTYYSCVSGKKKKQKTNRKYQRLILRTSAGRKEPGGRQRSQ